MLESLIEFVTSTQLRAVLETVRAGVIIADKEGKLRLINGAAERVLGKGLSDAPASDWSAHYGVFMTDGETPFPADEYPLLRALKGEVVDGVEMFVRNSGVPNGVNVSVSAIPLRDDNGEVTGAVATLYDHSPLKLIEGQLDDLGRQLVAAQKMEAIGRFAGGIAHDYNNQLAVILSFAHLALDGISNTNPARDDLKEVIAAAERSATLTRQLLSLSRRQVADARTIEPDDTIEKVANVIDRLIGEDIELKMNLNGGDAKVVIDPGQLEQVLMNLVVNARDAMPEGGSLFIETRKVSLDDDYVSAHFDVKAGDYYCLIVTDSGEGMTTDTRTRLFEPYFTTKEVGRGSGLGLSIIHGIARQASGHVSVYSEENQGASFRVYLPLAGEAPERMQLPGSDIDVDGTGRTVLLVEDDERVRNAASRILRRSGFTVLVAANAEEARSIALGVETEIDVLLSDVVMPKVSGPDLAVQLSKLLPDMRVVLMSGYPADALTHRHKDLENVKLISKPFTPGELLAAVGSAMAPRRDTGRVDNSKGRVLLVEDNEALLKATSRKLQREGFDVVSVQTVKSALKSIVSETVDVVVSDVQLPDGSGLELLKRIRASDMDVPVILVTGSPNVHVATEAIRYGALRFLTKPVETRELKKQVEYAVRAGRLSRIKREALNLLGKDAGSPRDLAGVEACFDNALADLWVEFQPIMRAEERVVHAYEVLVRCGEPSLKNPITLLGAAARLNRSAELGRHIRSHAAAIFDQLQPETQLFVNLQASDLEDSHLFDPKSPLSRQAHRVVLEITEREALEPGNQLEDRVARLRDLGFRIAVDDLGAGYSGLSTFAQLSPDIAKLDMSLVRDIDSVIAKQRTVGAMVDLCHSMGISVVAEGIETPSERDCILALGCDLLQGYFFARPSRELAMSGA